MCPASTMPMVLGMVMIPPRCPWGCAADEPLWEHPQLQGCTTCLQNLCAKSSMAKGPSLLLDGTRDRPCRDPWPVCWERWPIPPDAGAQLGFN